MSIRLRGFDEMRRKLHDLGTRAERLHGEHEIDFTDLFTTDFVRRFTDFLTLDELFAASGFKIASTADFEKIPADQWNAFIQQNTLFGSWQEMQEKAMGEWMARRVGFSE